jgi:hypothetical protein
MSITNPETYGESFWGPQVEANKAFADEEEKGLAPFVQAITGLVVGLEGFPAELTSLFNAVGQPGHFAVAGIAKDLLGGTATSGIGAGLSPFLRALGYAANKKFPSANIEMPQAITLAQRNKIIPELFNSRSLSAGFTEAEARLNYEASMPYPSITDLIAWARYTTDDTDTKNTVWRKFDVMEDDWNMWEWLTQQRLSPADIQSLFVRGYLDRTSATQELIRQGWTGSDVTTMLEIAYTMPAPMILIQAGLLHDRSFESVVEDIRLAGIHPDYCNDYMHAVLSKPNPEEMIRYRLRTDPDLSDLTRDLSRIGVHPDYIDVYKQLAYPVPPIGDMITMAVREAFSPGIAARFGQYDDYPTDLTRFASMNGISEEWAKRYWAAHWSLPSPQQGFEMFHRGIITYDDLSLLMRALDIMPFWRDKLIQAAYKPLTRIDVRRMFQLGVLSEGEVEKAYRDVGYDNQNASRLRDYVVRDTQRSQSGMSVSKVVTAYKNGYTTRSDANNTLIMLGISSHTASNILESADKQLQWQRVKDGIAAIGHQYTTGLKTEQETRQALSAYSLDQIKVTNLLDKWEKDGAKMHDELWTKADTIGLYKKGIITQARASQELSALGYNTERANALITAAKPKVG